MAFVGERRRTGTVGAVLAGGAASRMGGDKAGAELDGRPLIAYPLAALATRLDDLIVVTKAATRLPGLPSGVRRVDEPDEPRHPAAGVVAALAAAGGRPVVVLPCDLPFVNEGVIDVLLAEPAGGSAVVAGVAGGRVQPLVARYEPEALKGLEGFDPVSSMTGLALALGASLVAVDEESVRGINSRDELEELSRRSRS